MQILSSWILAALCCGVLAVNSHGQELTRNETTGIYTLHYVDADGQQRTLNFQGAGDVRLRIHTVVERAGTEWRYTHDIVNTGTPGPAQSASHISFLCPADTEEPNAGQLSEWFFLRGIDHATGKSVCLVSFRGRAFNVSDSIQDVTFQSDWLPGVVEGRGFGIPSPPITWGQEYEMVPPRALALVDSLEGLGFSDGGGAPLSIVGPKFSPDSTSDSGAMLRFILGETDLTCDLAWITNPGVCNSLRTKLEQASRALERGRNEAAVGQLQAFLNELEAQHGEEPGKHVNDNAYWLLKINVEFILERMAAGEA